MEKKFKHNRTGEIATYKDGVLKSSGFSVEIGVEPSSEYWEEIVEKDYKVLEIAIRRSDKHEIRDFSECRDGYITSILNCEGNYIHSVKRLSDGELFTIGDICNPTTHAHINNQHPITKFELILNGSTLRVQSKNWYLGLDNIEKVKSKPVLFTTEDGVDFYNHGILYYVKDFMQGHCHSDSGFYHDNKNNIKLFSSKEKAEEWILINKPCLSINDLIIHPEIKIKATDIPRLKKLVKSKL